ncbi:uncharacterized protein HaLaN_25838 [Haematococcus lacustris]|uniref:Uncharacterized protein n=1 Tax=Haematococcus lacustris TaxID=44745 RepID=A0A6A0A4Q0_HAELA|nr:uncharacterized protein HaLaN_25838 [Haematococcus lacustris]
MDMPSTAVYEGPLDANTRQQWEYQALGRFDESGRLLGPQFPRTHLLLLYRLDWFNSLGLQPPNTWEELIAVTLALRRLDAFSSGPGDLDYSIMNGEGWLLDPVDMSLLTSSPAGAEALRLYTQLASLALPRSDLSEPLQSCSALNRRFVQGNCAMTIDWDVAMMYAYNNVDALDDVAQYGLQGRLGWAPLPGSTKVLCTIALNCSANPPPC